MTASIPNGFSSDDLEALMKRASKDITDVEPSGEGPYGDQGLTQSELEQLTEEIIDESLDRCNDPMLHKMIIIVLCYRFATWHRNIGNRHFSEGNTESGGAWMRDAGKFQAMLDILTSVAIGPDDFTAQQLS